MDTWLKTSPTRYNKDKKILEKLRLLQKKRSRHQIIEVSEFNRANLLKSQSNQPHASEIQAIFDRIAPVYDRLNNSLSFGQHRIWKLMAVKWSAPSPGDLGLDLCCGSGDLAQLLARQVGATGRVIGADFSKEQLAIARQRNSSLLSPLPIEWIEADALNLPFDDGTFDCATIGYGLRNVIDIPRCLQELHRVLKREAKAAILDFHRPSQSLMRTFQQWYLQTMVVPTARRFGLTDEYAYISPSLDRFPTGVEQVKLAYRAGFSHAVHYPIAGGMMGVLVVKKGSSESLKSEV